MGEGYLERLAEGLAAGGYREGLFIILSNVGTATVVTAKRDSERFGRRAERAAAIYLALKGYRILARRFRSPAGEIDLIARRGRLVVYVEVKARTGEAAVIRERQRRRIRRAAEHFLKLRPELASREQRFDAILIRPWALPAHLKDAWRD